jgi:hypothetical protein
LTGGTTRLCIDATFRLILLKTCGAAKKCL